MQNELPHGDWRETLESGFIAALDGLCPPNGIAYILLRYHDTETFFPILSSPSVFDDRQWPYYFFPFTYQRSFYDAGGYTNVDTSTLKVEELDARCRMELARAFVPMFHQQVDVICDEERDGVFTPQILLVRSSPSHKPEPFVASAATSSWLAKTANAYFAVWSHLHRIKETSFFSSVEAVVRDVAQHLADSNATPPYFPLLRFKVHFKRGDLEAYTFSGHNFLAFNCYLRASAKDPKSDAPWVYETPAKCEQNGAEWLEDCEDFLKERNLSVSAEVQHYISHTKDVVRVVARCSNNGKPVLFVARFNKPKGSTVNLIKDGAVADVTSFGEGCSLLFQISPEHDDVLVTYWAIPTDGKSEPFHLGAKQGVAAFQLPAGTFPDDPKNCLPADPFTVTWIPLEDSYTHRVADEVKLLLADRISKTPGAIVAPQDVYERLDALARGLDTEMGFHGSNVPGMFPAYEVNGISVHNPQNWTQAIYEAVAPKAGALLQRFLQELHFREYPQFPVNDLHKWIITALARVMKGRISVPLLLHICFPAFSIDSEELLKSIQGWQIDFGKSTNQKADRRKAALLVSAMKNLRGQGFIANKEWDMYEETKVSGGIHVLVLRFEGKDNTEEHELATILRPQNFNFFPDDATAQRERVGNQLTRSARALAQCGARLNVSHNSNGADHMWILEAKLNLNKIDARYILS